MMATLDISQYEDMWTKHLSHYVLTPTPPVFRKRDKSPYLIMWKMLIGYAFVGYPLILGEKIAVIEKMIEAGVQIVPNEQIFAPQMKRIEAIWQHRIDEYALYHTEQEDYVGYIIYHKLSGGEIIPKEKGQKDFLKWIDKMIEAGVEILDSNPRNKGE